MSAQSRAPRGAPGHGRTLPLQASLPAWHVLIELAAQCPRCGLQLRVFPGTDDGEIVEVEVEAYRQVVHRRRYAPVCRCGCLASNGKHTTPGRLIASLRLKVTQG